MSSKSRRIAYIYTAPLKSDGVSKKVLSQARALSTYGPLEFISFKYPVKWLERFKPLRVLYNQTVFQLRAIRASIRADIVYYRYAAQNFLLNTFFACGGARHSLVLENNTNNQAEFITKRLLATAALNFLFERALTRRADLNVALTEELKRYVQDLADGSSRVVTITNGYDPRWVITPSEAGLQKWNERLGQLRSSYNLAVFVGYSEVWHGVDRIIELIRHQSNWALVLVGPGLEQSYGHMVEGDLIGRIAFLGEQVSEDLVCIYSMCDLALGSFALERKGMREAAPLKVREYLFYGLPVVIGYRDPIADECPRMQEIDPSDSSISLDALLKTLASNNFDGLERLTWDHQMSRVIATLDPDLSANITSTVPGEGEAEERIQEAYQ